MNYIIFDLEATCWEKGESGINEIIEIGAVKLDDRLEIIDSFNRFIKPVLNPVLSDFCTKLTDIKQDDIDFADTFSDVMKEFEQWVVNEDKQVVLCSWGHYDKKQVLEECIAKDYTGEIIKLLATHVSLKHQFAKFMAIKPCGMKQALVMSGLELEGTHHRGIDDARNIAKIFVVHFDKFSF
jgi:inhibitor of KinA sporulation pathway (predicted exonuclease)